MRILITGGAGFIGCNLVQRLLEDQRVSFVRVLDDLSTGSFLNLKRFLNNPKFEFVEGSICDYELCLKSTIGIDRISHQASLGSVPRSISNPMLSSQVNVQGTINLLYSAFVNKVDRIILASSSSVYGDNLDLEKNENNIGNALSPYAATKQTTEIFAKVFNKNYGINFICLRYFNVFGPYQDSNSLFAAVIPLFCQNFLNNQSPLVFGNGETNRDFTYVDNIILANLLALFTPDNNCLNTSYNVGCGVSISLNQIISFLSDITGKKLSPTYTSSRMGDILRSQADLTKISNNLGYSPIVHFKDGLELTYRYYSDKYIPYI